MAAVRQLFDGKDYAGAMRALAQYRAPDEIYDRERQLLEILVRLSLAEEAIGDGREPYALELLEAVAALVEGHYRKKLEAGRRDLVIAALQRRGFSYSVIKEAIRRVEEGE